MCSLETGYHVTQILMVFSQMAETLLSLMENQPLLALVK